MTRFSVVRFSSSTSSAGALGGDRLTEDGRAAVVGADKPRVPSPKADPFGSGPTPPAGGEMRCGPARGRVFRKRCEEHCLGIGSFSLCFLLTHGVYGALTREIWPPYLGFPLFAFVLVSNLLNPCFPLPSTSHITPNFCAEIFLGKRVREALRGKTSSLTFLGVPPSLQKSAENAELPHTLPRHQEEQEMVLTGVHIGCRPLPSRPTWLRPWQTLLSHLSQRSQEPKRNITSLGGRRDRRRLQRRLLVMPSRLASHADGRPAGADKP